MPHITLDLDDDTARHLGAICGAYNLTPSQLTRCIVRRLIVLIHDAACDPSWAQRGRPLPLDDALGPPGHPHG